MSSHRCPKCGAMLTPGNQSYCWRCGAWSEPAPEPPAEVERAEVTDSERLDWLGDQLWNGWTVECWQASQRPYLLSHPDYSPVGFDGEGLREAIDKAMEAEDD